MRECKQLLEVETQLATARDMMAVAEQIDLKTATDEEIVATAKAAQAEAEAVEVGSSPSRWVVADSYAELANRDWTQTEIAEEFGTNQATVSKFIACATNYSVVNNRPPFWTAFSEVNGKTTAERLVASDENEWYTPAKYVEAARTVLGGIDLDPASSAAANKTVQAKRFYTSDDDSLHQRWHGRVWLNPPYGRLAGDFARRLVLEYQAGEVEAAVLLVNAHCTDTDWFQPLWDYHLCFTDHRIDFDSAGRAKNTTSTHGSVFVYLGPDVEPFKREFTAFGPIVRRA